MSRNHVDYSPDVHVIWGNDHALGEFIQIYDNRFAGTEGDPQGEGYVFEWDRLFGVTLNLIGLPKEKMENAIILSDLKDLVLGKCNEFVNSLNKEDD